MLSSSIQYVGNNLSSVDNQYYDSSLNSNLDSNLDSSNSFESVLRTVENIPNTSYKVRSTTIANVPMGIVGRTGSYEVPYNNSVLNGNNTSNLVDSLVESSSSINNSVSNYVEVTNKNATQKQHIEDAVTIASNKYGVDENLIKAVIKAESNFNPNVVSSAGAKGLMQVMPANYKNLGISNPFDIYENVDGGTKLLREYIDKYDGDVEMALMAYNGGPTRMKNRGVTSIDHIYKMPKETQNYVKKVMNYYRGE